MNVLDSADKGKIWYPKLGFTNALGPFQTQMDELTSGVLIREGDPIKEDVTLAIEGINPIQGEGYYRTNRNLRLITSILFL